MIIGIDFGTTNSVVAYVDENMKVNVIVNERGSRLTPSVVYFKNEKQVFVGEMAKSQMLLKPSQTVSKVKRKIGTDHTYKIFDKKYKPYEIGSLIFSKLKKYSSEFLGMNVEKAVVTVPAYFDDNQRQGVIKAAKLVGIDVVKLLNEPTAAALAYGVPNDESTVLVLDLGGGTFDITLMRQSNGLFEVLTTGGSTELGGSDFDEILAGWLVDEFQTDTGVDLSTDPIALQQIYNAVERAKIDLSNVNDTNVVIPYIALTERGPLHINKILTRELFDSLCKNLIEKIDELIDETLSEADLSPDQVNMLVFSGGASRMPFFRKLSQKFPNAQIKAEINPDEVVAMGAAVQAAMIEGRIKSVELRDILPHSLGVLDDDDNFVEIIKKGTIYPTVATKMFTNTEDNQDTVTIQVLQERGKKLVNLGKFHFKSSKKWKKNEANIAVSFSLNNNGVLEVSAEDVDTGEVEEVVITDSIFNYFDEELHQLDLEII
ncbi:MAG: Hsp70 family protein [Thermotogae bacterium]|nr:Hsp70 family protein [Thermotogota bacterium]